MSNAHHPDEYQMGNWANPVAAWPVRSSLRRMNDAIEGGNHTSLPPIRTSNNGEEQGGEESEATFTKAGVWMLAALLMLLSIILILLVVHMMYRRRHMQQLLGGERRLPTLLDEEALRERIEKRYETIEVWMINKRVMEHDEFCENCLHVLADQRKKNPGQDGYCHPTHAAKKKKKKKMTSTDSKTPVCIPCTTEMATVEPTSSTDLEPSSSLFLDEIVPTCSTMGALECPICFEEFQVGDIVTFSPNESECSHVFHHKCIKEWLLRNTGCPFCRKVCIPTDLVHRDTDNNNTTSESKEQRLKEFQRQHNQRSATTIFCQTQGLLTVPSRINCTDRDLKELVHRMRTSAVDRATLAEQRKTEYHIKTYLHRSSELDESTNRSQDENDDDQRHVLSLSSQDADHETPPVTSEPLDSIEVVSPHSSTVESNPDDPHPADNEEGQRHDNGPSPCDQPATRSSPQRVDGDSWDHPEGPLKSPPPTTTTTESPTSVVHNDDDDERNHPAESAVAATDTEERIRVDELEAAESGTVTRVMDTNSSLEHGEECVEVSSVPSTEDDLPETTLFASI